MYDFVLTNGTVIDPAVGLNARRNVALQGGRVAAILDPTVPVVARQMLDCTGLLVVPGLIDFHVHVFPGVSNFGVDPDETCLARGATTVLDFGTAGGLIFDGFRRFVIDTAKTRVKALMLIAGQGLISSNDTKPAARRVVGHRLQRRRGLRAGGRETSRLRGRHQSAVHGRHLE